MIDETLSVDKLKDISKRARLHIIEMVYGAKSGHPGGSLSIIDVLTVLYFREMNIDPLNLHDANRDMFVLSKGHASPALYSILSIKGYFPEELLSGFRKISSKLEGHVHYGVPGVEASTGSLGQGLGVGIGMAIASKLDKKKNYVYVVIGDGEIEEGSIWESFMAGYKYKLNNLIVILDRNMVQLDGFTEDIMPMIDIKAKVESFGWNVLEIDGHNYDEIISSIEKAKRSDKYPTLIIARTVKGKGVSYMENNPKYHGSPPESEELYMRALAEIREN